MSPFNYRNIKKLVFVEKKTGFQPKHLSFLHFQKKKKTISWTLGRPLITFYSNSIKPLNPEKLTNLSAL